MEDVEDERACRPGRLERRVGEGEQEERLGRRVRVVTAGLVVVAGGGRAARLEGHHLAPRVARAARSVSLLLLLFPGVTGVVDEWKDTPAPNGLADASTSGPLGCDADDTDALAPANGSALVADTLTNTGAGRAW